MMVQLTGQSAGTTELDEALAWAIALLLSISLVMVYSASVAYAEADAGTQNRYYYLIRHALNNELLRKLLITPDAWEYVSFSDPQDAPSSFHRIPVEV